MHETKSFVCTQTGCTATFMKKQYLKDHVARVHISPVHCPFEDCKSLIKPAGMKQHIAVSHNKERGECTNCGKEMKKLSLYKHTTICRNTGEKKYPCKSAGCDKSFKTPHEAKQHALAVHSSTIVCPYENCGALIKPAYRWQHIKLIHKKVLRAQCINCRKVLTSIYVLKHMRNCKGRDAAKDPYGF